METTARKFPLRFLNKVNTDGKCWIWTAAKDNGGYGRFKVGKSELYAHRYAWEVLFGEIPAGLMVCHKCDIRNCVNPEHLFLGTQQDNMTDKVLKGRGANGERNGQSKLTKLQVDEIRRRYATGVFTQRYLAKMYGVHQALIHNIITYKSWR